MQSTHRLNYLCSCAIAFFISASFLISPCCEKQMENFEVAVMCAGGWVDGWDSLSDIFVFFSLSPNVAPSLHTSRHCCICVFACTSWSMYEGTQVLIVCVTVSVYFCVDACTSVYVSVCVCASWSRQRPSQSPLAGRMCVQRSNEGVISLAGRSSAIS